MEISCSPFKRFSKSHLPEDAWRIIKSYLLGKYAKEYQDTKAYFYGYYFGPAAKTNLKSDGICHSILNDNMSMLMEYCVYTNAVPYRDRRLFQKFLQCKEDFNNVNKFCVTRGLSNWYEAFDMVNNEIICTLEKLLSKE